MRRPIYVHESYSQSDILKHTVDGVTDKLSIKGTGIINIVQGGATPGTGTVDQLKYNLDPQYISELEDNQEYTIFLEITENNYEQGDFSEIRVYLSDDSGNQQYSNLMEMYDAVGQMHFKITATGLPPDKNNVRIKFKHVNNGVDNSAGRTITVKNVMLIKGSYSYDINFFNGKKCFGPDIHLLSVETDIPDKPPVPQKPTVIIPTIIEGTLEASSGREQPGTNTVRTDFINVENGKSYYVTYNPDVLTSAVWTYIYFFNDSDNLVGEREKFLDHSGLYEFTVSNPEIKKVRILFGDKRGTQEQLKNGIDVTFQEKLTLPFIGNLIDMEKDKYDGYYTDNLVKGPTQGGAGNFYLASFYTVLQPNTSYEMNWSYKSNVGNYIYKIVNVGLFTHKPKEGDTSVPIVSGRGDTSCIFQTTNKVHMIVYLGYTNPKSAGTPLQDLELVQSVPFSEEHDENIRYDYKKYKLPRELCEGEELAYDPEYNKYVIRDASNKKVKQLTDIFNPYFKTFSPNTWFIVKDSHNLNGSVSFEYLRLHYNDKSKLLILKSGETIDTGDYDEIEFKPGDHYIFFKKGRNCEPDKTVLFTDIVKVITLNY